MVLNVYVVPSAEHAQCTHGTTQWSRNTFSQPLQIHLSKFFITNWYCTFVQMEMEAFWFYDFGEELKFGWFAEAGPGNDDAHPAWGPSIVPPNGVQDAKRPSEV